VSILPENMLVSVLSRKSLTAVVVAALVVILARSGLIANPKPARRLPPPSPLMAAMEHETLAIRNLFRNSNSSRRGRKRIARSCERLQNLAETLKERPESSTRWPDVTPERWTELAEDVSTSAGELEDLVLSDSEPALSPVRSAFTRILASCVRCHSATYQRD
jgi:hypothetical protein